SPTEIPGGFREFMAEVEQMIRTGADEVRIESDDLIQGDRVYGGLSDAASSVFKFTYFPSKGTRPKWQISLSSEQVAQIASDQLSTIDLFACADTSCGCRFSDPADTCFWCDWREDATQ